MNSDLLQPAYEATREIGMSVSCSASISLFPDDAADSNALLRAANLAELTVSGG